ncbi:hypothetical protein [Desulfosporosinus meridiei]|nr:hypothetical protein [Desulfosporosinus meridiei]
MSIKDGGISASNSLEKGELMAKRTAAKTAEKSLGLLLSSDHLSRNYSML